MRHGRTINHLGRKAPHRKRMMGNMASSLIRYKRIRTTLAKARALRQYVEPLITKAKTDTTHSRRIVFTYLQDKSAVHELFGTVAAKVGERPGGYTRIFKIGPRPGDNADMAVIELVDFNEAYVIEKQTSETRKKKTRRAGSGKTAPEKKKEEAPPKIEDDIPEGDVEVPEDIIETPVTDEASTEGGDESTSEEAKEEASKG